MPTQFVFFELFRGVPGLAKQSGNDPRRKVRRPHDMLCGHSLSTLAGQQDVFDEMLNGDI